MRNLFTALGLEKYADEILVRNAVSELAEHDPETAERAAGVLSDRYRRRVYTQVHDQFDSLSECLEIFDDRSTDSNHWHKRLVEF